MVVEFVFFWIFSVFFDYGFNVEKVGFRRFVRKGRVIIVH